jgi:TolA-binding protein
MMWTPPGDSKGRRALADLSELARASAQPPTPTQLDRGLDSLAGRIAASRSRRRRLVRWSLVGTLATATVLAAVGIVRLARTRWPAARPALTYRIEGGSLIDGGYLRESGHAGVKVLFTEGTQFILMPGTRSRLRSVDSLGARLAIEHGTAAFQVRPDGEHKWMVDVGPFLVTVKGTVFTASWDATTERFDLKLRRGRVAVSGPTSGGDIVLQAGQRMMVDLSKNETVITEPDQSGQEAPLAPVAPGAMIPVDSPLAVPRKVTVHGGASPSHATVVAGTDGDRRWAEALAAGHLDRILAEAEKAGVQTTLERATSDDLFALADAARYRKRVELARKALLAERRRFPASPRTSDVAFLLGRVEEMREHGMAHALEWYDAYLTSTPDGTYASEALGRKMTLTNKLEGVESARPIAQEYLRRFPTGTYAGPARALQPHP